MSIKITAVLLIVCIASCISEDPKAQANQAKNPAPAPDQAAQQAAAGQAAPAPKKSEFAGARDEFVGGVAAIADSASRVGQAAINKVVGIKDNLANMGSKIADTWSAAAQNTKDIVKNVGNTDNTAPAAQAAAQSKKQ